MVNYTSHHLVAFGGHFVGQTKEGWECTVRVSSNGGGGEVLDEEVYLSSIMPNLKTWFASPQNAMNVLSTLEYIKCNRIGADGRYVDKTNTHRRDFAAVAGNVGAVGPGFLSIAVTFHTAKLRGRAHMGRIYLPNNCKSLTSAMQISATDATAVANAGARLLRLLKNPTTAPSGWGTDTWAGGTGTSPTPGIYSAIDGSVNAITATSADTVMDVQRRRKEQVTGTRVAQIPL